MKLTQNQKTILSICTFVIVFAILLLIATFFDLQISQILTKNSLKPGEYITNDFFASFMEIFGSAPAAILLGISAIILFLNVMRFLKGWKKWLFGIITGVLSVYAFYYFLSDVWKYAFKHILYEQGILSTIEINLSSNYSSSSWFIATILAISILIDLFAIFAMNKVNDETLKKLLKFAVVVIIVAGIPTILINLIIKKPWGRIRYRAMNMYGDDPIYGFSAFTPWYNPKGQWLDNNTKLAIFGSTDVLKSFPSGHTAAAGATYALLALPKILGKEDNKKLVAIVWTISILWTTLCAIGRIVAGAHFMSDVLFGGTMAFLCYAGANEFYLNKSKNLKALFAKK